MEKYYKFCSTYTLLLNEPLSVMYLKDFSVGSLPVFVIQIRSGKDPSLTSLPLHYYYFFLKKKEAA
jgi:hypothetical protein